MALRKGTRIGLAALSPGVLAGSIGGASKFEPAAGSAACKALLCTHYAQFWRGGGSPGVANSMIGYVLKETDSYQVHTIWAVPRALSVSSKFIQLASLHRPDFAGLIVVLHGNWTGRMSEGLVVGPHAAGDSFAIWCDMKYPHSMFRNFDTDVPAARLGMSADRLSHSDGRPREDFVAEWPMELAGNGLCGKDPLLPDAVRNLSKLVEQPVGAKSGRSDLRTFPNWF